MSGYFLQCRPANGGREWCLQCRPTSSVVMYSLNSMWPTPTPTRTSSPTFHFPRGSSRGSRRVRRVQLAISRARTTILADLSADLSDARFFSRGCPLGMRAFILYTMSYRVPVYTCTRLQNYTIRRIPKFRVGVSVRVGPMEFQLIGPSIFSVLRNRVRLSRSGQRASCLRVCVCCQTAQ